MYARLNITVENDIIVAIRKLRQAIPKVSHVFFPQQDLRGQEHCGFEFHSEDALLDWNSISTWCDVTPRFDFPKNSCTLVSVSKQREAMRSLLIIIEDVIGTELPFDCYFKYRNKAWKKHFFKFSVAINEHTAPCALCFEQPPFESKQPKFCDLRESFWSAAKNKFECLKDVEIRFPNEESQLLEFDFESKQDFHLTNANGYQYLNSYIRNPEVIGSTLREAVEFTEELATKIDLFDVMFSGQLMSDIAPKIVTHLRSHSWNAEVAFEGQYHSEFHPDQFTHQFPLEGYWRFPLFRTKVGSQDENGADFYLVQTPKERFFELAFQTDDSPKKLEKFLTKHKVELPLIEWKGAIDERWGLNAFRKI